MGVLVDRAVSMFVCCEWIIRDSACLCVVSGRGEGNGTGWLLYGEL